MTGGTVCGSHGGRAPQVRKAAEVRAAKMAAMEQAERMVARAGVDADPIEHLLESLHRAAALVEVWGQVVAERDEGFGNNLTTMNDKGDLNIHPFVHEYNQALDRRAKFAKMCLDAGVAERQVRIAEEQGQLIARAITAVLDDLKVKRTAKVNSIIGKRLRELTPNFG